MPKKSGTEQDMWPEDSDKEIVCIHVAGGQDPTKFNYDWLPNKFTKEVALYLKYLISDEKEA